MNIQVYSACIGSHLYFRQDNVHMENDCDKFKEPVMNAKMPKVLSHLYFPDAEYTIWIDNNVKLKKRPEEYVEMLDGRYVGVFKHWFRDCLYEEAEECMIHELDSPKNIIPQIKRYRQEGFPEHAGLGMCFLVVRKNDPVVNAMNLEWWAEICTGSVRDQISFPYVFRDKVKYFEPYKHGINNNNEYFYRATQ